MHRPLVLSGFMGTGKSVVGRAAAEQAGFDFVDLDEVIEARAQCSIADVFARGGERGFRDLERECLFSELDRAREVPKVLSLGGGALLDRATRIEVLGRAVVVVLEAPVQEIVRRVREQDAGKGTRPLLAGADPETRIRSLLAERAEGYAECHAAIGTEGLSPVEVARKALSVWKEDAVAVAAGMESYVVRIGSNVIEDHLASVVGTPSGTLLVTDENVSPLHGDKARRPLEALGSRRTEVVLTPGEEHKNLDGLSRIYLAAFDEGLDRKATFVGLGGGVVTDMTGFAAATWVRGVRWVGAPTTLLSMVDASVGGKTAVDFRTAKNSVGAFWQPSAVLCDVETLLTETDRAYLGALSEVVKTALIGDAPLLDFLEDRSEDVRSRDRATMKEVVDRCVRVKARIVALDEREAGLRATLNLGHTIGHALEASSGYTGLTHGEAVSLGLVAALRFGERKGHTPRELTKRVLALLKELGLPHQLSKKALQNSTELLGHDKKRAGDAVRFVFARGAGDVFGESTPLREIEEVAPHLAD